MEKIKLFQALAKRFPKSIKSRGDRVGLMTGKLPDQINSILLCLDFDEEVLNIVKSRKEKPDLILTHHPFIYGPRQRVLKHHDAKRFVCEEVDKLRIPVYSMHTNFDSGKDGMNDALANALKLKDIKPLETVPMARGGELEKAMEIHEFALYANKCLNIEYSHLINGGTKQIKKVAIIGGAGSRDFLKVKDEGYDIFLSGDIPHHARRDILAFHYNFLDVSHEIERIFMPQMKKILHEIDPTLKVEIIDHEVIPELIK
jgi:dinuclear metal center YbgI/SA1388 family protein